MPQGRTRLLTAVGLLLGATVYRRQAESAAERREKLARGELRELRDDYRTISGLRWYARVAMAPHHPEYRPIVCVHGFGISSVYFVPMTERLAPDFDVFAPDLPGHGKTATPPEPLDIGGQAEALRRWLEATRLERVCLVGNSMGCQTAVELAFRSPRAVDRLVLIGPTMDREARSIPRALPRLVAGSALERASMSLLLARDYSRMNLRLIDEARAMFAHRIEDRLPCLKAPVLFVRGEHDRIAPQDWVDELARLTNDAPVVVIPGGGHAVQYSDADDTVAAIAPFLRASEPGAKEALANRQ